MLRAVIRTVCTETKRKGDKLATLPQSRGFSVRELFSVEVTRSVRSKIDMIARYLRQKKNNVFKVLSQPFQPTFSLKK